MDLNDFFGPNPDVIELHADNRWEAIDELIDHLVADHKIKSEDRETIVEKVKKRESSMSFRQGSGSASDCHTLRPI